MKRTRVPWRTAPGVARRLAAGMLGVVVAASIACADGPTSLLVPRTVQVRVDNSSGTAVSVGDGAVTLLHATGIRLHASVRGRDGKPIEGFAPSWRSTDPSVAIVAPAIDPASTSAEASATIGSGAPGTALIIASVGGIADTVVVTVIGFVEDSHGFTAPPQSSRFDMSVRVQGFVQQPAGASTRVLETLVGATVTLTLLPPRATDRVPTSGVIVIEPTLAAIARTDASGIVWFRNVPTNRYRLEITPPSGSAWQATSGEGPPPSYAFVHNDIWLRRP